MPPTIEATVANKMDLLFTLRKLMGNRALQPAVHVGNHTTTIAGCTTSAEVSSAIQGIVDRAVGKGEDAFVLAEVSLGQDLPRKGGVKTLSFQLESNVYPHTIFQKRQKPTLELEYL